MNTPSSIETNPAYKYAVRLISLRDYSRPKIRKKLREKKFDPASIDEAIQLLEEKNLIREKSYIESKVRSLGRRGQSPTLIAMHLKREGLSIELTTITEILSESNICDDEQIDELIRKKYPKNPYIDEAPQLSINDKQKLMRYLLSKGHPFPIVTRKIKAYFEDSASRNYD